ncbi:PREDICTED: cell wall integrity and stress response component 1 [Theobroma cacao]|uniref:Cell wall integrity and stress response component 1 n=1 Tax=Theobroma cacao TaxID=3641 RepID=A0AB32UR61_THECC|nr:PREDICTED: cell wall integrity and stress response component 1 [Theobroma cacao]
MATTSSSRPRLSGPVLRSLSPSGRFHSSQTNTVLSSSSSSSSSFASSTSSSFSSPSSTFFDHHHHHRSASPTRVNLCTSNPVVHPFRFSINRSISPNRSISVSKGSNPLSIPPKRTCMCSPTTHPGSFRCSLHKNSQNADANYTASYPSNRLNIRRSAMTNSLVRIGGVEGDWVKRALTALIRPSSHQQRRRAAFRPRPSRLSVLSES